MQQQNCRVADVCKDVVIIGNGPSGICLSYLLAGNWPHYTGNAHPCDEMLTARLNYVVAAQRPKTDDTSLPKCRNCRNHCMLKFSRREQLELVASGLEGRNSGKPLSLLMDQLQHPCLDAGLDVPSLLEWCSPEEHPDHRPIDHIVLGKGPPGGAWHSLDPRVLTISLKRWMSLPGLDLRQWESNMSAAERRQKLACFDGDADIGSGKSTRVPIGTVAAYYKDYVVKQGLDKYFRCGTVVTTVKSIPEAGNSADEYGWLIEGYEILTGQPFRYRCRRVVLATGTTDSSNRLGTPGEEIYHWVTHDFNELEKKLDLSISPKIATTRTSLGISEEYGLHEAKEKLEPVLIVGSGLSAADAIMAARYRGVPVLHVFRHNNKDKSDRKRSFDKLRWLPASIYPEYHKVYEMMADRGSNYPLYKPLPDHVLVEFSIGADKLARTKTRKVTLCTPQGRLVSYRISFAAILIGSKPDLSYMQNGAVGLGKFSDKPIDSRSNPIDVDLFTYRARKASRSGLYAIGPLAGDNFVRFILGGAFGVLTDILHSSQCATARANSHCCNCCTTQTSNI